uniref:Uncharacterized protein n=1 Tax=Steinernema glaseri TaxID=37863 RepID=A0A1I7YH65_9BILA
MDHGAARLVSRTLRGFESSQRGGVPEADDLLHELYVSVLNWEEGWEKKLQNSETIESQTSLETSTSLDSNCSFRCLDSGLYCLVDSTALSDRLYRAAPRL